MTVELTAAEVLKWQCFFYCKYQNKKHYELKQIYKSNVLIYHPDKPPLGCGQKFGILKQEFDDYETWKKINYDRQYYYDDAKEWRNTEHSQAVTAEAQKRTAATRKLEKTAARAARKQKRAEQEAAEQEAAEEKAPQKERTPSPPTFKRQMSPRSKHARTQWYKKKYFSKKRYRWSKSDPPRCGWSSNGGCLELKYSKSWLKKNIIGRRNIPQPSLPVSTVDFCKMAPPDFGGARRQGVVLKSIVKTIRDVQNWIETSLYDV